MGYSPVLVTVAITINPLVTSNNKQTGKVISGHPGLSDERYFSR